MPKKTSRVVTKQEPLRFAHPFFTTTPAESRKGRLLDHIKGKLQPIPKPSRAPLITLAEIIGMQGSRQIRASGRIKFHAVGDTGRSADSPQGDVAEAMIHDYDIDHPQNSPAFFFHLGDVIYGINKDERYRQEFYEPYVHYPGKIIAIPGNHDGEVFPKSDPKTLHAFLSNFCAASQKVPAIAGTIFRETVNQPGVYWLLDTPFVHIVAMYSNAAENPGFISGKIPGQSQTAWLLKTLKKIRAQRDAGERKALVFATHHPPFTAGGHSPSSEMLSEIDDVCQTAGVYPDMFLSGHAHSYQRYTRTLTIAGAQKQVAFIVAGTGGINDQAVHIATGQTLNGVTFVKSMKGFGYLLLESSDSRLSSTMVAVDPVTKTRSTFDTVNIDLKTNQVS